MKMTTGCPDCDRTSLSGTPFCPKHRVEYLKWVADAAKNDYEKAKNQYEQEQEREPK